MYSSTKKEDISISIKNCGHIQSNAWLVGI